MNIHISIAPETIINIAGFPINNSFILTLIISFMLIIFSIWFKKESNNKQKSSAYIFFSSLFSGMLSFFESVAGKKAITFYPILMTFFLFIIVSNWSGLLPGVGTIGFKKDNHMLTPIFRGPTADLNTTLALALISIISIQYFAIKFLGFKGFIKKYINFSNPINFFVGILEILSEISKVLSFSFRLFGNIFAGEVLLVVIAALIPVFAPLPFLGLELFVGFIQALVFTMLSLVFMATATADHEH